MDSDIGGWNFDYHLSKFIEHRIYPQTAVGDEPEPLNTRIISLQDLEAVCQWPDFNEARSIAALFLVRSYLQGRG